MMIVKSCPVESIKGFADVLLLLYLLKFYANIFPFYLYIPKYFYSKDIDLFLNEFLFLQFGDDFHYQ